MDNYENKYVKDVEENLNNLKLNVVLIGNGDKIINQYPSASTNLLSGDKIFLLTNGNEKKMPNMTNWSKKDVIEFFELAKIKYNIEGNGYVYEQSIKENEILTNDLEVNIKLKDRFLEKENTE